MLFYKGVDHMRCLTPPMRETDEDAVVFGQSLRRYIIRAQGRIIVFFLNTAVFVIVVQII